MGIFRDGRHWFIDLRINGKRRRKKVGPSKEVALLVLKDLEVKKAKGELLGIFEERKILFKDYADSWLKERKLHVKPSTFRDDRSIFKNYLNPYFAETYLSRVMEADIERFISTLGHLGPKRINNIMVPLKTLFKTAYRRKEIKDNPCQFIKKLKEPKPEIFPLSFDEVKRFLNKVDPSYYNYFATAFLTGMRPNELIALKWKNIDLTLGKITVREGRVQGVESSPKTESSYREVDVLLPLRRLLSDQKAKTFFKGPYVFTSRNGTPLDVDNLRNRVWYPTLRRSGLRDRTMYQIRHTFATLMLSSGENPNWVAQMMGHSSTEMLFRRYSKFIPNLTRNDGSAFLSIWDGHFLDTCGNEKGVAQSQPLETLGSGGWI
jgi:integrase